MPTRAKAMPPGIGPALHPLRPTRQQQASQRGHHLRSTVCGGLTGVSRHEANKVRWEAAVGAAAALTMVHAGMLVPHAACLLQAPAHPAGAAAGTPYLQPQHAQVHHQKGREGQDGAVGVLRLNRRLAGRQVWAKGTRQGAGGHYGGTRRRWLCTVVALQSSAACFQHAGRLQSCPTTLLHLQGALALKGSRWATSGGWLASPHLELLAHRLRHLLLLLTPHPAGYHWIRLLGPMGGVRTAPWRQEA